MLIRDILRACEPYVDTDAEITVWSDGYRIVAPTQGEPQTDWRALSSSAVNYGPRERIERVQPPAREVRRVRSPITFKVDSDWVITASGFGAWKMREEYRQNSPFDERLRKQGVYDQRPKYHLSTGFEVSRWVDSNGAVLPRTEIYAHVLCQRYATLIDDLHDFTSRFGPTEPEPDTQCRICAGRLRNRMQTNREALEALASAHSFKVVD